MPNSKLILPPVHKSDSDISIDTSKLCSLVNSIWKSQDPKADELDWNRHKNFICQAKSCIKKSHVFDLKRQVNKKFLEEPEELRLLTHTSSTLAKRRIKLSHLQKELQLKDVKQNDSQSTTSKTNLDQQSQNVEERQEQNKSEPLPKKGSGKVDKKSRKRPKGKSIHPQMVRLDSSVARGFLLEVLSISPINRSKEQIKKIFPILRNIPAFSKISDFVLEHLCGIITFEFIPKGKLVFKQGEFGTTWYVIFEGSVSVLVADHAGLISNIIATDGHTEEEIVLKVSNVVLKLERGYGFGELALVNDSKRSASVLTLSDAILLKVEKRDYNQIVRYLHDQEVKEKLLFLKHLPFADSILDIQSLANTMIMRTFEKDYDILKYGDIVNYIYLIKEGRVQSYGRFEEVDCRGTPRLHKVPLGELGVGELFGEDAWSAHILNKYDVGFEFKSHMSIKALTPVVVGMIALPDAIRRFPRNLQLSAISLAAASPEGIAQKHHEILDAKKWDVYKERVMDSLYREKYHDPRMTRAKVREHKTFIPFK